MKRAFVAAVLALGLAGALQAQGPSATNGYPGVRPGSGNPPPLEGVARARAARGERLVTWPGFQMLADGRSQFFLQMSGPVRITEEQSRGRFEVRLTETSTHLRNTRRPLETRFFNTPVTRATVKRRGRKDLAVIFELRADVAPTVTTEARDDGYHYVLVTFPAGSYVETPPPAPEPAAPPPEPSPSVAPTEAPAPAPRAGRGQAVDAERPPAMRP